MDTVTSRDGTTIAFDTSGKGAPVIFVGPALADRSAGAPLAAPLARTFTVFNYDRRGRGDSGDTPPYAVQREVEDLAALVEAAGGSAFVVGGSSGAVLALDAAAHGLAVTKVALYEPPFILDASRQVPDDLLQQLTARLDAGRRGEAVAYWMTVLMGVPADQVAGMRQAPFWQGLERLASTLAYDAAIMEGIQTGGPLPRDRWAGLTVPTLVRTVGPARRSCTARPRPWLTCCLMVGAAPWPGRPPRWTQWSWPTWWPSSSPVERHLRHRAQAP
jgi:hypothetical protein